MDARSTGTLSFFDNAGHRTDHSGLGVDAVSLSAVPAHGDYAFSVFGVSTNGSLWRYFKDKNIGESVTEAPDAARQ